LREWRSLRLNGEDTLLREGFHLSLSVVEKLLYLFEGIHLVAVALRRRRLQGLLLVINRIAERVVE